METLIRILGRLLAALPDWAARGLCVLIGRIAYLIPSRRRVVLNNLQHAFPDKSPAWRKRIARENFARMIEMFLFAVVAPALTSEELRKRVAFSEETLRNLDAITRNGVICGVAHLTMMECLTILPLLDSRVPPTASFYRPLDFKPLDKVVREARQRFGTVLLSRKQDLLKARRILEKNGWVGVLFDQNAGGPGGLITMFNRVASATDLPGILAGRFGADVYTFFPERTGFWRARIHVEKLQAPTDPATISIALHDRLAQYLSSSDDRCADWLWAHERWKIHSRTRCRLSLAHNKRNYLSETLRYYGLDTLPQAEDFIVRLPEPPDAIEAALPQIEKLRSHRPDARITLLVPEKAAQTVASFSGADAVVPLPRHWLRKFSVLLQLRQRIPDVLLVLPQSLCTGLEAKIIGSVRSYGIAGPKRNRFGIRHVYSHGDSEASSSHNLYESFFQYFGIRDSER